MHARGVQWFSITDHDTIRAYEGLEVPAGMTVVPGIEINTTWNGSDVHILGYGIPLGPSPLAAAIERNRAARRRRIETMVAGLSAAGYPLTVEQVESESNGEALGRPHTARALVRAGYVADVDAAFRTLLCAGAPGYAPSHHITPREAIAVVRDAGGIPVLAHPGRLKDDRIIDELAEEGLAGLEVFYPTHSTAQVAHYRAAAARLGLVMTAGADFHDERWNPRGVGMVVDDADVRPFLSRVAELSPYPTR